VSAVSQIRLQHKTLGLGERQLVDIPEPHLLSVCVFFQEILAKVINLYMTEIWHGWMKAMVMRLLQLIFL
jgi:hypothetical protein